jgi:hypothetical protein
VFASVLALSVASCIPSAKPKAAASLACGEDQITVDDAGGMSDIVAGCGKKDVLTYDGSKGGWSSLRERAAFEMSCSAGQLEVTILAQDTYGLTGCNKKMVYKRMPYVGIVAETTQETAPPDTKPAGQ